jgi:hypothetical protein
MNTCLHAWFFMCEGLSVRCRIRARNSGPWPLQREQVGAVKEVVGARP